MLSPRSARPTALIELRGAEGTAIDAARIFFSPGMTTGSQSRGTIAGNPVVSAEFTAPDGQGGSVKGIAAFFEYGAATWRTLAYSTAGRYDDWKSAFQQSINSFDRLTDPVALAVQPMRLRIDAAPQAMSLSQFNAQLPSSISLAELALINGVPEGAQLRAGQSIKRVIGTLPYKSAVRLDKPRGTRMGRPARGRTAIGARAHELSQQSCVAPLGRAR